MGEHRVEWINRADAAEAIWKLNEDDLHFLNRLIVGRLDKTAELLVRKLRAQDGSAVAGRG